jgi:hypothetical protein
MVWDAGWYKYAAFLLLVLISVHQSSLRSSILFIDLPTHQSALQPIAGNLLKH